MSTETFLSYTLTATRVKDEDGGSTATSVVVIENLPVDVGDGHTGEESFEIADVFIDDAGHADVFFADDAHHFCGPEDVDAFAAMLRHCWCVAAAAKEDEEQEERRNVN